MVVRGGGGAGKEVKDSGSRSCLSTIVILLASCSPLERLLGSLRNTIRSHCFGERPIPSVVALLNRVGLIDKQVLDPESSGDGDVGLGS